MKAKKWVGLFCLTVALLVGLVMAFNYVTDPFGAFGDPLFQWFSYDETNNPRVAKISYLDTHHEEYDSYILGCSSTSSFPTEAFNQLYDANFYNLIMYDADMLDCEKIARYLIDHYEVRYLILNVYIDNGITYDEESNNLTKNLHYKTDPDASALSYYSRYLLANPQFGLAKLKALRQDTLDARSMAEGKAVVAIGSEGRGLSREVLALCDATVRIPMAEHCESLNAAAAAAVLLWELARRDAPGK